MRRFDGKLVAQKRRQCGFTQRKLSERINLAQTSISAIETNVKEPRASTISKLADALRCEPNDFFSEE